MSLGLVGRKIGMTRIFTENGDSLPVTVIDVSNNRVTQIKKTEKDGYSAVQLCFGEKRAIRVNKSSAGHFAKAGVEAGCILREFRVNKDEDLNQLQNGMVITYDIFTVGQKVDISGITIGKGYAGVIKRHHFSSNRASHGNSKAHNKPGSIGMAQDPGRIFPGKRMSGHLGNVKRTTQNLEVIRIDTERSLLLVKGAIPGPRNGNVVVRPSIKEKK
ncbi:MAG: 50S ribosomal protein L3 [Nitrosomonas sp.]|jgi:large subunit ribosomal protein L3|uniref:50S ribosomal protein L3 n=1 Tax=Nitrosomonas sp. TaxID=42353 RepID=UPI002728218A|nr:50S ribosomal protein L3 [Nitrosomonas sp.]MDO8894128.1 50S ribosomal protein L3 [Nitrosomonas sp.]MDO9469731.1 50S ribosomal protein L3 [Nitrosomonas sp.]MDP1551013.1 50S ribosomal protein L3 [Nitrosomonas sp.]MDP1787306.1 50S ribosomal protein L3 [Nitrosomonas sp.]MDP2223832.1 50S ribosomal protein L3 [Nitrosomonas sp.]